jgi:ubiquinone/menaquinone biosynthesis C-methylase UbiE
MVATNAPKFEKNTGVYSVLSDAARAAKDYTHYWQVWHHNWDDSDAELFIRECQLQDKDVLEVGCGDGRITLALSEHCRTITGVDFLDILIQSADSRVASAEETNIRFKTMDAQHLFFRDERFDLVLFPWVLQMVADPTKALKEAYRVLKPGGQVAIIALRTDADYDAIINRFAAKTWIIDPIEMYEKPLESVFGKGVQSNRWLTKHPFYYYFETLDIAHDAFIFALDRWYSTKLDKQREAELRDLLTNYLAEGRVRLCFPANVYFASKT